MNTNPSGTVNPIWFNGKQIGTYGIAEYLPPLRLFIDVDIDPPYRGKVAVYSCRMHLRTIFLMHDVEAVYVSTHKREGAAFAALCGFTRVGFFPRFCLEDGEVLDTWIYRLTREALTNG